MSLGLSGYVLTPEDSSPSPDLQVGHLDAQFCPVFENFMTISISKFSAHWAHDYECGLASPSVAKISDTTDSLVITDSPGGAQTLEFVALPKF